MKKWLAILALATGATAAASFGQPAAAGKSRSSLVPPHLIMERLSRMKPEERDQLLRRLPPDRRSVLEDRLRKYSELPETAKKRLRDEYNVFQQLPPEKQAEMRKLFRQLGEFPEDRRAKLRRELVRLRKMAPERREARLKSARLKREFSEEERQFLLSLTELLVRPPAAN